MKMLMTYCKKLESITVEPASRAIKTPFVEEGVPQTKLERGACTVVFVCIEKSDNKDIVKKAAHKLKEQLRDTKLPVVIIPFIHLTNNPASSKRAYMEIKELSSRLGKDYSVETLLFGWHRSLLMDIIAGKGAFDYMEIKVS